jgi:hypothetical protein
MKVKMLNQALTLRRITSNPLGWMMRMSSQPTKSEPPRRSIPTIEALRLKPSSLSRMQVPLCRMVPMPIVRPTLSSDLASLEDEFVHGYWEGAAVFYLSITNEGGQIEKVTDEDLASWGPY